MHKAAENVMLFVAAIIVVADIVMDVTATAAVGQFSSLWWLLAAAVTAALVFLEPEVAATMGFRKNSTTPMVTESLIDPSIICRWNAVRNEFGIDPYESRAEITQFPSVLAQIELAEAARIGCSVRAIRVTLGERVMILIRETLGPLAAELTYLNSEEDRVRDVVTNTLTQQRQYEQDAAAELLACSPI